jgi:hypothetical protein
MRCRGGTECSKWVGLIGFSRGGSLINVEFLERELVGPYKFGREQVGNRGLGMGYGGVNVRGGGAYSAECRLAKQQVGGVIGFCVLGRRVGRGSSQALHTLVRDLVGPYKFRREQVRSRGSSTAGLGHPVRGGRGSCHGL